MEPLHLIIVVSLAAWLGARIGRKAPWSTRRGLVALALVAPLALAVGVSPVEVLVDAAMLAVGFLWVRWRGRSSAGATPRGSTHDRTVEAGSHEAGGPAHRPSLPPTRIADIRNRRREEMAQLRAQRRGRKAPIF